MDKKIEKLYDIEFDKYNIYPKLESVADEIQNLSLKELEEAYQDIGVKFGKKAIKHIYALAKNSTDMENLESDVISCFNNAFEEDSELKSDQRYEELLKRVKRDFSRNCRIDQDDLNRMRKKEKVEKEMSRLNGQNMESAEQVVLISQKDSIKIKHYLWDMLVSYSDDRNYIDNASRRTGFIGVTGIRYDPRFGGSIRDLDISLDNGIPFFEYDGIRIPLLDDLGIDAYLRAFEPSCNEIEEEDRFEYLHGLYIRGNIWPKDVELTEDNLLMFHAASIYQDPRFEDNVPEWVSNALGKTCLNGNESNICFFIGDRGKFLKEEIEKEIAHRKKKDESTDYDM